MTCDDVPSVADRFAEINAKLDQVSKAIALILAAMVQQPVEIDIRLLEELGYTRPGSIVRPIIVHQ